MDLLSGKAITALKRKLNDLITGYNTNVTNISTNTTGIASILAGNVGENVAAAGDAIGNAGVLSASKFIHRVSGADATKGVILPAEMTVKEKLYSITRKIVKQYEGY